MGHSEYSIYSDVKDAIKRARKYGKLRWWSDGWELKTKVNIVLGKTANELHYYLNGFEDGILEKLKGAKNGRI